MISAQEKQELVRTFTELLPVLRAAINASQAEVSAAAGISRQTYCSIEQKKRELTWNTFLSLAIFFAANDYSLKVMKAKKDLISTIRNALSLSYDPNATTDENTKEVENTIFE